MRGNQSHYNKYTTFIFEILRKILKRFESLERCFIEVGVALVSFYTLLWLQVVELFNKPLRIYYFTYLYLCVVDLFLHSLHLYELLNDVERHI